MKVIQYIMMLLAILLAGCGRSPGDGGGAAATSTAPATSQAGGARIISTVPAATLNLVLIGAADTLVGVTKYDQENLPDKQKKLPPVGDYQTMNYEALVQLRPTALVLQTAEHRIEPRLRDMAERYHFALVNIKLDTVADMFATVERLGKVSGHEAEAQRKIEQAKAELAEIAKAVGPRKKPRVLYVVGSNPLYIVGGHTFLDEMITAAGGENVGAKVGDLWPTIGQEALVQLSPEVILVGSPGEAGLAVGDPRTEPYRRLPVPAARSGRVFIVNDFNGQQASVEIGRQVRALAQLIYAGTAEGAPAGAGP
jgi:iron complex transport system substrate-binding protein